MKATPISLALLLAAVAVTIPVLAQDAPAKPCPEAHKLDYLAGKWRLEGDLVAGVMGPGGKFTGISQLEWMEGGCYLVEHEKYGGALGDDATLSILGFDRERGVYTYYGFNSDGSKEISTGNPTVTGWVWTHPAKLNGKPATVRYTMTIVSRTEYSVRSEISQDGQNWTLFLSGTAHRLQ